MEPNKLENQIKMLLANREIQPSQAAFQKLDFMLAKKEVQPKMYFTWVHFAASLLVFFAIGLSFLKNESSKIKERVLVETMQGVIKKNPMKECHEPKKAVVSIEKKKPLVLKEKKAPADRNPVVINQKNELEPLPAQSIPHEMNIKSASIVAVPEQSISSDINSKIKVDPNLLLSKVDDELEPSFRERVVIKMNKNFQSVKIALSNRNNQE